MDGGVRGPKVPLSVGYTSGQSEGGVVEKPVIGMIGWYDLVMSELMSLIVY